MLNFTLNNLAYTPTTAEEEIIRENPPQVAEDWSNNRYNNYKTNLKAHVLLNQRDRCAYCRKIVEADGKYEPLEHIVAKTIKPAWLLHPKNLVVTCDSCNNLKGDEPVLTDEYQNANDFPDISAAYKIFQPYFDNWSDHLAYEDDLFIVPIRNSKGKETIRICKLFRYNVIINRSKELKLGQKSPIGKIVHRLRGLDKQDDQFNTDFTELLNAIEHFRSRTNDSFV